MGRGILWRFVKTVVGVAAFVVADNQWAPLTLELCCDLLRVPLVPLLFSFQV